MAEKGKIKLQDLIDLGMSREEIIETFDIHPMTWYKWLDKYKGLVGPQFQDEAFILYEKLKGKKGKVMNSVLIDNTPNPEEMSLEEKKRDIFMFLKKHKIKKTKVGEMLGYTQTWLWQHVKHDFDVPALKKRILDAANKNANKNATVKEISKKQKTQKITKGTSELIIVHEKPNQDRPSLKNPEESVVCLEARHRSENNEDIMVVVTKNADVANSIINNFLNK